MKKKILRIILTILPVVCLFVTYMIVAIPFGGRKSNNKGDDGGYQGAYFAKASEGSPAYGQSKSYKGGVVFIEPNASYTMNGGSITGTSRKFGGAVYVSNGATFTMNAGRISSCTATYGGAIYVESGGNLILNGGTITANSANYGPSIYVESGASITIGGDAVLDSNGMMYETLLDISDEEIELDVDIYTRYVTIGSYPQSVANADMQTILTNWANGITSNSIESGGTEFVENYGRLYTYTDGNVYVYDQCYGGYDFGENGEIYAADGEYLWFKVEPIKWWIINPDGYEAGMTDFWLLSEKALTTSELTTTSDIYDSGDNKFGWGSERIRTWLNSGFYNFAFTDADKDIIENSYNLNNSIVDGVENDSENYATYDYVFLLSRDEMNPESYSNCTGLETILWGLGANINFEKADYSNLMLNGYNINHTMLRTTTSFEWYDDVNYNTAYTYWVWDNDMSNVDDSIYSGSWGMVYTTISYIRPSIKLSI